MDVRAARRGRRGTTALEMAFALPVFLTFVFGLLEFGRAQMLANLLKTACRNGARQGALEGFSSAQVQAMVKQAVGSAINPNAVTVVVKNAGVWDDGGNIPDTAAEFDALSNIELAQADPRQLFLVRATVNYGSVALLANSWFKSVTLTGQSFMRHE